MGCDINTENKEQMYGISQSAADSRLRGAVEEGLSPGTSVEHSADKPRLDLRLDLRDEISSTR